MSLDLGAYVLDADKYGMTLSRKRQRINKITGASSDYLETIGHYGTIAQVSFRLAEIPASEAIAACKSLDAIATTITESAARIEAALTQAHPREKESS